MLDTVFRNRVEQLFGSASITIDGNNPWDVRVHDTRFYRRALLQGNLGLGESYMDGWWDCDDLEGFFDRLLSAHVDSKVLILAKRLSSISGHLFNLQSPARAFIIGKQHYDIGNRLFEAMLDRSMSYSCGFWDGARTLDEAQVNKLRMVFDKLDIEPGMRVLDIGCGWGGAARLAADEYGAKVLGITVSGEQATLARERCRGADVEIRLMDYRRLEGSFDRIWSIGMLEHVGHRNYRSFFDTAKRCLAPEGRLLVHTIGGNSPNYGNDPWISRYIFPNSLIPSASQIAAAYEGRFILEDWHGFAHDYALTLRAWDENFRQNWQKLRPDYDDRFYRMWRYYLMSCAGSFSSRHSQLWQILLTPEGLRGDYRIPHAPLGSELFKGRENGREKSAQKHAQEPRLHRGSPQSGAAPGS